MANLGTSMTKSSRTTFTASTNSSTDITTPASEIEATLKGILAGLGLVLGFILLLLFVGGCIYITRQKCKRRRQRLRNHTFSIFDIAAIFDNNRESYAELRNRSADLIRENCSTSSSVRRTHSYAELVLNANDPDYDKSEVQSDTECSIKDVERTESNTKPDPPRKCNTLSGILWSRLGGGKRRNDRCTINRYLTARTGSSISTNDYVESSVEDIRIGWDMADKRANSNEEDFVPEDDNLWERCSRDGSLEHDVTLRQQDGCHHSTGHLETRRSVMSDFLRSSWIEMTPVSQNTDYCNMSKIGSKTSMVEKEGVFIPEDGSDHPLGETDAPSINQLSQNIIDMIKEQFSVQHRESDSYKMEVNSATLPHPQPGMNPFIAQLFSEPQSPPSLPKKPTISSTRVQSVTPLESEQIFPDIPSKNVVCETLPRSQKRPLPPIPNRKPRSESSGSESEARRAATIPSQPALYCLPNKAKKREIIKPSALQLPFDQPSISKKENNIIVSPHGDSNIGKSATLQSTSFRTKNTISGSIDIDSDIGKPTLQSPTSQSHVSVKNSTVSGSQREGSDTRKPTALQSPPQLFKSGSLRDDFNTKKTLQLPVYEETESMCAIDNDFVQHDKSPEPELEDERIPTSQSALGQLSFGRMKKNETISKLNDDRQPLVVKPPPDQSCTSRKESENSCNPCLDRDMPTSNATSGSEQEYANLPLPISSSSRKPLPPPPPPKHSKPKLDSDSSESYSSELSDSISPAVEAPSVVTSNFLKVTQQLQQTLAMRLPGQLKHVKADTPTVTDDADEQ